MCNLNVVEDEYHFILQCEKYIDVRRYLKKYYWQMPSCFKLIQLLSVRNIKELNNLGKYLPDYICTRHDMITNYLHVCDVC
jgi:hypothetical protein